MYVSSHSLAWPPFWINFHSPWTNQSRDFCCVPGSSLLPPPYWKTRRPWGRGCYKQAFVYEVTESRRIRGTELYRQQKPLHVRWSWKVTSVWIKHGRNGRVNFEQDLVLIHCPHSSGGCWLPDNGFVGIRGLSLERLCTLFHKCWPKQRSIQLEISVRQAKHDS